MADARCVCLCVLCVDGCAGVALSCVEKKMMQKTYRIVQTRTMLRNGVGNFNINWGHLWLGSAEAVGLFS